MLNQLSRLGALKIFLVQVSVVSLIVTEQTKLPEAGLLFAMLRHILLSLDILSRVLDLRF